MLHVEPERGRMPTHAIGGDEDRIVSLLQRLADAAGLDEAVELVLVVVNWLLAANKRLTIFGRTRAPARGLVVDKVPQGSTSSFKLAARSFS